MAKKFHDNAFDEGTQTKLEIFKMYIRNWLPKFMTATRDSRRNFGTIRIYDFFSGPGYDCKGVVGSPLIIIDELKNYCETNNDLKANIEVEILFNDKDSDNIEQLKENAKSVKCSNKCCQFEYTNETFDEAISKTLPKLKKNESANLIIMDQCGVDCITPDILNELSKLHHTDILFFISTSVINRFKDIFCPKLNIDIDSIKETPYKMIHKFVCENFRKHTVREYYLAPFSIKKGSNIYGIIFGSGNLRGLETFLEVCWKIDENSGEDNSNLIGDEWVDMPLFHPVELPLKQEIFLQELVQYVAKNSPSNLDLYEFGLLNGFPPKIVKSLLEKLQNDDKIKVNDIQTGVEVRRKAFYLREKQVKVQFKGKANEK